MRIGIDARFYRESGIGRYLRNLLTELQKLDKYNEYFIFLLKKDFESLEFSPNFHKVEADFNWYGVSEQTKFPKLLNKYNLDLVHIPHFNIPVFYTGNLIATIHDLTHFDFKMKKASTHNAVMYEIKHHSYKLIMDQAIKRSKKIITVSEFVRDEIINRWGVGGRRLEDISAKIRVTPEAADDRLINLANEIKVSDIQQTLEKFNISPYFIFYVGNAHPHKNVEGLIKTFYILKHKFPNLQLVLSGPDNYFWQRLKVEYEEPDIIFTGFITDQELVALYKSAKAYVFPSFSEGFGIPLLEAMACGCPVVSSNKTSLPEVGGEAAIYFDPKNIEEMEDKIAQVLGNQNLANELVEKGIKRYKEFSWKRMAEQTLEVYKSIE